MPKTYSLPDDDVVQMLASVKREYHPDLEAYGVRIQPIFVSTDGDGPAVKHGGYPAVASIKAVPGKDRLTKRYDAELLIDRTLWDGFSDQHRRALLDHELMHLEVKTDDAGSPVLDDLGRPKLKMRPGDWNAGDGFKAVVERHGDYADEFDALRRAYLIACRARDGADSADRPISD